jgi:putative endonuclease
MTAVSAGRAGEQAAREFLLKKGYTILESNTRNPYGEIDIIAKHRSVIIFVEVKLRKSDAFARGAEHVDFRKQERYLNAASFWLAKNAPDAQARFDVVELYGDTSNPKTLKINHIENAFSA